MDENNLGRHLIFLYCVLKCNAIIGIYLGDVVTSLYGFNVTWRMQNNDDCLKLELRSSDLGV